MLRTTLRGALFIGLLLNPCSYLLFPVLFAQLPDGDPLLGIRTIVQEEEILLFYAQSGDEAGGEVVTIKVDGGTTKTLVTNVINSNIPSLEGGTDVASGRWFGDEYGAAVAFGYRSGDGAIGKATLAVEANFALGSSVSPSNLVGSNQLVGDLYTADPDHVFPRTEVVMGNFSSSNPDEEVCVIYTGSDKRIHVQSYALLRRTATLLLPYLIGEYVTDPLTFSSPGKLIQVVDATAADVDLDGQDELLIVYWDDQEAILEILEVSDENGWVRRSRTPIFKNAYHYCREQTDDPFAFEYLSLKIEAGDFVSEFPGEEFVVGLNFTGSSGSPANEGLYLMPLREQDGRVTVPSWCQESGLQQYYSNAGARNNSRPNPLDVAAGDLDGDLDDELVMGSANVRVFDLQKGGLNNPAGFVMRETTSFEATTDWATKGEVLDNFLAVGNLDKLRGGSSDDFRAEIVVASQQEIDDDFGSLERQELKVQVFRFPQFGNLDSPPVPDLTLDKLFPVEGNIDIRRYSLGIGDTDGGSIYLRPPARSSITEVLNPLVVLNAPPTHFDVFGSSVYDLCKLYGENAVEQFRAEYVQLTETQRGFETKFTSDYALAAGAKANLSLGVFDVGVKMSSKYGERFEKVNNSTTSVTLKEQRSALLDDELLAYLVDFDVYEYPIMETGNTAAPLSHVIVSIPGPPRRTFIPARSTTIDYIVDHQHGNLFSYPAEISEFLPVQGEVYEFTGQTISKTSGGNSSFSISRQEAVSQGVEQEVTTATTIGASIGGAFKGFGLSVDVEANYSDAQLKNRTSSYKEDVSMTGALGVGEQEIPGDMDYTVVPSIYWDGNGSLALDYAVRLTNIGFWKTFYDKYDPAFLLLDPFKPEKGSEKLTEYNEADRYRTRDIRFAGQPHPGGRTTIHTRMYNFGFKEIAFDPGLDVCMYYLDPESGNQLVPIGCQTLARAIQGRLNGKDLVELAFIWDIPEDLGPQTQVVGIIDPENAYPGEVHDYPIGNGITNNLAWACAFTQNCELPESADVYFPEGSTAAGRIIKLVEGLQVGPNPMTTHGWMQIPARLEGDVTASLYDPLGREVKQWHFEGLVATDRTLLQLGSLPSTSYTLVVTGHEAVARVTLIIGSGR